jgi:hypothetical protein
VRDDGRLAGRWADHLRGGGGANDADYEECEGDFGGEWELVGEGGAEEDLSGGYGGLEVSWFG